MSTRKSNSIRRVGGGLTSVAKSVLGTVASVSGSVLNKAVDLLPFEAHIPGYQYCGPGTKLAKRLKRGDPGINKLDAACKVHDIAYSTYTDNKHRAEADRLLANKAWERVKATDSSVSEKATAWAVTNAMKVKAKFGGGKRKKSNKKTTVAARKRLNALKQLKTLVGKGLFLRPYKGAGSKAVKGQKKKKKTHSRSRT